jgi:hypothetical protein
MDAEQFEKNIFKSRFTNAIFLQSILKKKA